MTRGCGRLRGGLPPRALVLYPCFDIGAVDAFFAEQQFRHAGNRRRSVDLEIGYPIRAHVPTLQHQSGIVHAVVVVQMTDEYVRDVHGPAPTFYQAVMCARSMVHDDDITSDLDEIAGALPFQGRRGGACSEQYDLHVLLASSCCVLEGSRVKPPAAMGI